MDHKIIIEARNTGYSTDQVRKTVTVGELKDMLEYFDDDCKIYLSFDNGYTYGGITELKESIYGNYIL